MRPILFSLKFKHAFRAEVIDLWPICKCQKLRRYLFTSSARLLRSELRLTPLTFRHSSALCHVHGYKTTTHSWGNALPSYLSSMSEKRTDHSFFLNITKPLISTQHVGFTGTRHVKLSKDINFSVVCYLCFYLSSNISYTVYCVRLSKCTHLRFCSCGQVLCVYPSFT